MFKFIVDTILKSWYFNNLVIENLNFAADLLPHLIIFIMYKLKSSPVFLV